MFRAKINVSLFLLSFWVSCSCAAEKRFGLTSQSPLELLSTSPATVSTSTTTTSPANLIYSPNRWNDMRKAIESGREPWEIKPPIEEIEVSTRPRVPQEPAEDKTIALELPYESALSIAGRKTIELRLKSTHYKKSKAEQLKIPQSQQTIDMKQQLQARIQGQVGRKVTVNVDVDDTKENKQDIAVTYRGDPEEIVQTAQFGDIALSLPATEFVSYSKQVFGIKSDLKYKNMQATLIGTRTKGQTETKRFSGNVTMERKDILDTGYIRRRYYDLTFGDTAGGIVPIVNDSEEIWYDDRNPNNNMANTSEMVVESTDSVIVISSGTYDLLVRGRDYIVDYVKGLIQFKINVDQRAVIGVNYTRANGTRVSTSTSTLKLIKDEAESSATQELKTYYSVGRAKIVRDNGKGNFFFKILDLNRNEIAPAGLSTPVYPNDIEFDFESGVFNFARGKRFPENDIYTPSPIHRYIIFLEYRYREKIYMLRPNIVLQSERVVMDGKMLNRDIDYFIDYDSGILTFFNEDKITDTTAIEVTYEFAPFGGQLGETLVGGRTTYSMNPKSLGRLTIGSVSLGSSALLNFAPKPSSLPDVRATPSSILVLEGDSRISDIKLPFLPLQIRSLSAEIARSNQDPNTLDKALVESMESVRQEDTTAMIATSWVPGANPDNSVSRLSKLFLGDENIKLTDMNPNAPKDSNETQRILSLSWVNLSTTSGSGSSGSSENLSIVYAFSNIGRDFSKKNTLEVWVYGAGPNGAGVNLQVDMGAFKEDADGDGFLDTEDNKIKDGTLNLGEDIGWAFDQPESLGLVRVGNANGFLDSEDLDKDGMLDPEVTLRTTPIFKLSPTTGQSGFNPVTKTSETLLDLNFAGWRLFSIPLNITPAEEASWQAVKQVRLTISGETKPGAGIKIGGISIIGNTWERPAVTVGASSATVSAVNNIDTGDYDSLLSNADFTDLYGSVSQDRREQALNLSYNLTPGSTATTRTVYARAHDFSRHKSFRFFINGKNAERTGDEFFFLQLGSESDYFECRVPITMNSWQKININLVDRNNDGLPDAFVATDAGVTTSVKGNPSFTTISQLKLGVFNASTTATRLGHIWINEIHLVGGRNKTGQAGRFAGEFEVPGWMSFGGAYKDTNRNFQTLTTVISNQDRKDSSGHLNVSRIKFLPLNFSGSHSLTVTPSAIQTGDSQLVSSLEEGKVESISGSASSELGLATLFPRLSRWLPRITFGYDKSKSNSRLLRRIDDRDTYRGAVDYSFPVWQKLDILPGKFWAFRPFPSSISTSYSRSNYLLKLTTDTAKLQSIQSSTGAFNNATVLETQDNITGRLTLAPWDGFSLSPNWALKTVSEERRFQDKENVLAAFPNLTVISKTYPKSLNETAGLAGSLRLYFRWLEPRFNYSFNGTETNALPTASSPTAFNLKVLDRTSSGDVSWTAAFGNILPWAKPVRTLNVESSFRVENGDSYENVKKDFKWLSRVWVTKEELPVTNGGARRKSLTSRDTMRFRNTYTPFEFLPLGRRLAPIKTISTIGTYLSSQENTETTGTKSTVLSKTWPDLIVSIKDTERFVFLDRWVGNSQLNLRTNEKTTERISSSLNKSQNYGGDWRFTVLNKFDLFFNVDRNLGSDLNLNTGVLNSRNGSLSWSTQLGFNLGPWRYTPRYDVSRNLTQDGTGKDTADLTTRSTSLQVYGDLDLKTGLRLPFMRKGLGAGHRFIINSNLKWDRRASSLNVERDNTDNYSFNLNGDYTISKNFRLTMGGATSFLKNRVKSDENVLNVEFSSTLTIQF